MTLNKLFSFKWIVIHVVFAILSVMNTQAENLSGVVRDAKTQSALPFVNILVENTSNGAITDNDGNFTLIIDELPCYIIVKFIGYKSQRILIEDPKNQFEIDLEEEVQQLGDITVKPDNSYDLKLLRKVIRNRKNNNPKNWEELSYRDYQRNIVFLTNLKNSIRDSSKIFKQSSDAFISTSDSTVKMPFFISEIVSDHHKKAQDDKVSDTEIVRKSEGILAEISPQIQSVLDKRLTTEFNFYSNQIVILSKGFPSPISSTSLLYYNVYLTDSIREKGNKYYKFKFYPKSYKNVSFKGHFWVEDQTWALTSIKASLPNSANINFVSNFEVAVDYKKLENQKWFYDHQQVKLNMSIVKTKDDGKQKREFAVQKYISYTSVPQQMDLTDNLASVQSINSDSILISQRSLAPLNQSEQAAYDGIQQLKANPYLKALDKFSAMTLSGYYNLDKIDIGPYFSFYRKNEIEGDRFTLPFRTSKYLFENFMAGGFIGYGSKNKEWTYGTKLAYQFKTPKRTILSLNHHYDYFDLTRNKFVEFIRENPYMQGGGNIVSSFTSTIPNPYMIRNRHFDATLEYQINKSLGLLIRPSLNKYESNYNLPFIHQANTLNHFNTQNLLVDFRFSFSQDFDEGFFSRIYYGNQKPVIHFSALLGRYQLPGINNEDKSGVYAHLNASLKNRFNMGAAFVRYLIEGGYIVGDVPYPLLNLPRGTRDWGSARYHYNLLHHASFASDLYINSHFTLNGGGLIFNKLPLLKKLDLREVVTFKAFYGKLLGDHNSVLQLPSYLRKPSSTPYMEMSMGITNIFKCFRIEYVNRINKSSSFDSFSSKNGIRVRIEVSF